MENYILYTGIFLIGTVFGSFLNATAIRISQVIENFYDKCEKENWSFLKNLIEELKLLKLSNEPKRSYCPVCKNQLKWYHNIPIFSYIILGGKCSYCKTNIPFIYFFSEILLGILTLIIYYNSIKLRIPLFSTILFLLSIYIMYIGMVIDIKTRFIPDFSLILPIPFFILYSYYFNGKNLETVFMNSLYSLMFYFSIKYLLLFIYKKTGKIVIGIADIKLLAIIGIIVGIIKILWILIIASYLSIPFFVYNAIKNKDNSLDFGIYLYISFFIVLYYYNFLYHLIFH